MAACVACSCTVAKADQRWTLPQCLETACKPHVTVRLPQHLFAGQVCVSKFAQVTSNPSCFTAVAIAHTHIRRLSLNKFLLRFLMTQLWMITAILLPTFQLKNVGLSHQTLPPSPCFWLHPLLGKMSGMQDYLHLLQSKNGRRREGPATLAGFFTWIYRIHLYVTSFPKFVIACSCFVIHRQTQVYPSILLFSAQLGLLSS